MNWFYNLRVGTKLVASFIVVALIGALVAYIGVTKLQSIDKSYSELIENNLQPLGHVASASLDYQLVRVNLRDLLNDKTAQDMEQHIAGMKECDKAIDKELGIFEKSIRAENVKQEFESLRQSLTQYAPVKDHMIKLIQEGKKDEAMSIMRGEARTLSKSIQDSIDKLFQSKIANSEKESAQNTAEANSAIKFLLSVAGAGILLAIALGLFISKVIGSPIRKLAAAADKLALGDVNVSIEATTKDEVGMLSRSFQKVIENIKDASAAAEKVAAGDMTVEVKVKSENDLLGKGLNSMLDTIRNLLSGTEDLAKATRDGKLDTRGDAARYHGAWNQLVNNINELIDAFVAPINVTAEYVDRIGKGNIPPKITDEYKGDFNEIKNNLNSCIDAVNALVADADVLAQAAVEGKLATRADATKHQGDFRKIVEGVNNTLDAVIGPLNVAAEYVDRISKGNIPPAITDTYKGDFNEIKNNLNATVKMMNELLSETDKIVRAAANGELDKRADASLFAGGWNKLVSGVNDTITNIVDPLMVTADYVEKVSKGVIPPTITTEYKGQYNIIKNNLNAMVKMMNELLSETDKIVRAAANGELDKRADASLFVGGWNKLVSGVNDTITNIVKPLNVSAEYVDRISKGDIPPRITDEYKGDFNEIKNNLNNCIDNVNALTAEANMLAQAAVEGKLATRADATKHQGDFARSWKG